MCVNVCPLPNKDSTNVQTAPANPAKSDGGKKGNICPSPVSHINTADDDPHTCCKLLLYNSIKQVLGPAGSGARGLAVGSEPPPGHFQIQTEIENEGSGVRAAKCASSSFCTVG